ncbi:MAG: response regulator transcription factor [Filimonas sp.]|nr:response regulator transcription factor [Filimonas sp.]
MNIIIADDHGIVRYAITLILRHTYPDTIVTEAASMDEVSRQLSLKKFDLLILDIMMPGNNGPSSIKHIREIQPGLKILMISALEDKITIESYLRAGANGYLLKRFDIDETKNAIEQVLAGNLYVSNGFKDLMLKNNIQPRRERQSMYGLSEREVEVLKYLVEGKTSKEIAHLLNVKATTISTYKNRLYEKMQAASIVELMQKYQWMKDHEL